MSDHPSANAEMVVSATRALLKREDNLLKSTNTSRKKRKFDHSYGYRTQNDAMHLEKMSKIRTIFSTLHYA